MSNCVSPLGDGTVSRHRQSVLAAADASAWVGCLTIATLLRYGFNLTRSITFGLLLIVAAAVALQLAIGNATQLYRARWRVGSFEETLCLATTMLAVTVVITVFSVVSPQHVLPVSATVGGGALALLVASGLRVGWRLNGERTLRQPHSSERAIIFGAGEAGVQLVQALLADPSNGYLPVAVLDDDPAKRNLRLRHLKVAGNRDNLAAVASEQRAESVIIAIPSADSRLVRHITDLATSAGLATMVLPTVSQMLSSSVHTADIRPVTPEDLLGRRVIRTEVDLVGGYLTGKRVLVTGAGGSIGSELCRQIQRYEPSSLIMLDHDECGLHNVQLSIQGRAMLTDRALALCDIRDEASVARVFAEHHPQVVFHAAALKHLPLLEMWPDEAVKTNVVGTEFILEASNAWEVERFVNISTDKAVNPISVLGYTKRLGEQLTAGMAEESDGIYLSVRFGNVLGSRGSVLTTFRAQIAAGGPVTVTHPNVSRYFMTVEEAVELVIQAGAVGRDGEVLVLDMGEPVGISEVASQMVAASGQPIEIVYTGLRPGEKITEELFDDDDMASERRAHPQIAAVTVASRRPDKLGDLLQLRSAIAIRTRLAELCRRQPLLPVEEPVLVDERRDIVDHVVGL
jgi:FlaA1/EpsC-like NDP-sugar epimerase